MSNARDVLETRQIGIYFGAVLFAALIAFVVPGTTALEKAINPALAFMLFITFLQVPVAELGAAFLQMRFLGALLVTNFIAVPALVFALIQFLPVDPMIRLGVLLVLLTPCIDYVVTFTHIGRGDAKLLLSATPALLIVQMLALPVYLGAFLGDEASGLVQSGPFIHAFIWLIAIPLIAAALVRMAERKLPAMGKVSVCLGFLPVPATAVVLFIVVAAVVPQLGMALDGALLVLPIYIAFAVLAPVIGWVIARLVGVEVGGIRAVAFSAGTRNSLVVLPLAFAVPNAMPLLPAIIVTQTLVELVSEMIYVRVIANLGPESRDASA
ncbi:arsenic resistance protein [Agrobacterium sp. LC34]|uniref:arsenic resistance protein n=1 Tax=Agrobacterium sp. LC34 TaxID=1643810 RepID=UPI00062A174D|nr:arsenic resistance protein [Agrobacterium sp. LC34]TKT57434.1 arsenic resistance protein [Agrobacterium sp. LC34]